MNKHLLIGIVFLILLTTPALGIIVNEHRGYPNVRTTASLTNGVTPLNTRTIFIPFYASSNGLSTSRYADSTSKQYLAIKEIEKDFKIKITGILVVDTNFIYLLGEK
jgi:hypothetical protein